MPTLLLWSTFHAPVDVLLYAYLWALGGHQDVKEPGREHLAERCGVSQSTIGRSLARLTRTHADLLPPLLGRTRAGRRRGATTLTHLTPPDRHLFVEVPHQLLTDVTDPAVDLTAVDLRVWCALDDTAGADGQVLESMRHLHNRLRGSDTKLANPRVSFLWASVRRLEAAGWLIVARRPGHEHLLAVPTRRVNGVEGGRLAAALNALRPPVDNPTRAVDNTVDNRVAPRRPRHGSDRSTRNRSDRSKVKRDRTVREIPLSVIGAGDNHTRPARPQLSSVHGRHLHLVPPSPEPARPVRRLHLVPAPESPSPGRTSLPAPPATRDRHPRLQ